MIFLYQLQAQSKADYDLLKLAIFSVLACHWLVLDVFDQHFQPSVQQAAPLINLSNINNFFSEIFCYDGNQTRGIWVRKQEC